MKKIDEGCYKELALAEKKRKELFDKTMKERRERIFSGKMPGLSH